MKARLFQFATAIVLVCLTMSVSAAGGNRVFEEYTITAVETSELSSGIEKAWKLAYDTDESPIVITYKSNGKCKTYIVRGDHFEVVYECSKKGFGARMVKGSESLFPYELNSAVLNSSELAKQRILTPDRVDDKRALGLIAGFLPDLVNPSYQHLLN